MRFYEDPSTIYLDSAKAGPMYYELLDWRNKYEKNSLIKKSQIRESHKDDVIKVEKNLSKFFNVKTGDVFFSNSFSRGFHSLISQFKGEPSFLVLENDYPSISEAIIKNNFNIIYVKNDLSVEENIKIAVEKYQPDFLVISVIQWIDGIKIDLNFLKKLKSNNNQLSIIADGTQFCGTCEFDFNNSPFEVLISSGYKWMLAGYGVAFLLVKKDFYKNKFLQLNSSEFKKAIDIGHYDMLAIGSLEFSLNKLSTIINKIEKKLHDLSKYVKVELENIDMLDSKIKMRKSHSTIYNISDPKGRLYQHLISNNIICSQRGTGVRISFNFFNTKAEIKKFIKTLKSFSLSP